MTGYNFMLMIAVIMGCTFGNMLISTGTAQANASHTANSEVDMAIRAGGEARATFGRIVVIGMLLLFGLAGCSTTNSRDRALIAAGQAAATLPAMADSELACADEPRAPAPKGAARVRESQVTNYILDLREAGADCRDKLGVVRRVWRKVEDVRSRAVPPVNEGETK